MGPVRSTPSRNDYTLRILGTGAADPTLEKGSDVTVAHQATGVYRITFTQGPGAFVAVAGHCFGAATPSAVKGYTLTRDTPTAGTATTHPYLDISVWNSSFVASDLAATQYLDITIAFEG